MTGAGAVLGSIVVCTLNGTAGGNLSYIFAAPAGILVSAGALNMHFDPPLQAIAINTAITASCPALGTGNTNAAMSIHGFMM